VGWSQAGTSTPVRKSGTSSAAHPAYTCRDHGHVRRSADAVDALVTWAALALLERDGPHLLVPAPRSGTDVKGLRAERRKLTAKLNDLARLYSDGVFTEAGVRSERKKLDKRLDEIAAQLAASDQPDPLPEFRDPDADAEAVWDSLGIGRQHAIIKLLFEVVILPARHMGARFDPESVQITRRVPRPIE
jgi:hypothetical protein